MKKWEYAQALFPSNEHLKDQLDAYGKEGWELIEAVKADPYEGRGQYRFFFKRELLTEEKEKKENE